jgi:NAD(P)-dependent dehydrogenase (short-subunit alcohol dehydrogenase family)
MQGKVVVITGATSGIGEIAAGRLAQQGARLPHRPRSAPRPGDLTRLNSVAPDPGHRFYEADSRASEMKRTGEIARAEPRTMRDQQCRRLFSHRRVSEDGLELTFALNHTAYFVLTCALADRLKAAAPSRVVSTASGAHRSAHLDFDDLQCSRGYDGYKAYGRSKLCNILFTRALARRLAGTGVTANCLHPGFVATLRRSGRRLDALAIRAAKPPPSPGQGRQTIVWRAASPSRWRRGPPISQRAGHADGRGPGRCCRRPALGGIGPHRGCRSLAREQGIDPGPAVVAAAPRARSGQLESS